MPESVSELAQKYRDEMLRMYRTRPPGANPPPPRPGNNPNPPSPTPPPPRPGHNPDPPSPAPPPPRPGNNPNPPPFPRNSGIIPTDVQPENPPEMQEIQENPETPEVPDVPDIPETPEHQPDFNQDSDSDPEMNSQTDLQANLQTDSQDNPPVDSQSDSKINSQTDPSPELEEPVLPDYIQPVAPTLPDDWTAQEAYEQHNSAEGMLYVVASTADGAYPVPDARVTIYHNEIEGKTNLNYILKTDQSGITPTVRLPAPPAELSQTPGNVRPYAVYNIRIHAPGYFREEARDVPVFAGITSRQVFPMIPLPLAVDGDAETLQIAPQNPEV